MKAIYITFYLIRHLMRVWRSGQLRFRLETYGLYYPALPYKAPWWKVSFRGLWLLLCQFRSYAFWICEMEELRRTGPTGWWSERRSHKGSSDGES